MYKIVAFTDENDDLALVPSTWLDGTSCCLWPPFKNQAKIHALVKNAAKPGKNWKSFPIRELGDADSYDRGRQKLKISEETSCLETADSENDGDDEGQRKSKRRKRTTTRLISESSDSSDNDAGRLQELPEMPEATQTLLPPTPTHMLPPTPTHMQAQTQMHLQSPAQSHLDMQPLSRTHVQLPTLTRRHPTPTRPLPVPPSTGSQINFASPTASRSQLQSSADFQVNGVNLRLLHVMEQIREENRLLSKKMDKVLSRLEALQVGDAVDIPELPEDITLPVPDTEELKKLEELLADSLMERSLVAQMALKGGSTVKETTKRIMAALISRPLSLTLTWGGSKTKSAFSQLRLKKVLFKAVRKSLETAKANDKEIEHEVMEWFRGSGDRNGQRKERFRKQMSTEKN